MTLAYWLAWAVGEGGEILRFDSRYDSGLPASLPDTLQFVVAYKKEEYTPGFHYREMLQGARSDKDKWYIFTPEKVWADEGTHEEMVEKYIDHATAIIRKGTWTLDEIFDAITKEAWASDGRTQTKMDEKEIHKMMVEKERCC